MKQLKNIRSIHFIGICGYIMSAAAVMLKKMGYKITGSDQDAYPPGTEMIDKAGIKWFRKYSSSNLDSPDLVVVGNHIKSDNSEAQTAIKKKLAVVSLPELIAKIFADKKRIVIAGTHGKTTTSSLIAWVLETANLNPSYLIGGIMQNTDQGFKLGKGDFFVIEGDEYRTAFFDQRPKFFHYKPDIAIFTTCEFDHPDYFESFLEVKKVFLKFLNLVPEEGLIILGVDDSDIFKIQKGVDRPKISYGLNEKAQCRGFDIEYGTPAKFKVRIGDEFLGEFKIFLPGKINIQNALAAIAVAHHLGIDIEKIQKGISSFKGVKRRFEIVGQVKGVAVIDDYAHHPTKIRKTLAAARTRYRKNKIYCIFEPHTYSRTKTLLVDYAQAFKQADEVVIAKLMPSREAGQKPSISSQEVVRAIKKYNSNVKLIPQSLKILEYLVGEVRKGDVVIIMSVGGLDNLAQKLVERLKGLDPIKGLTLKGVRLNELLAKHTTFRIGGPADLFFRAKNIQDLKKVVQAAKKLKISYFILSGGSNVLVSDKGFRGLVIKNQSSKINISGEKVEADSGVLVSRLVKSTLDKGLVGLEHFWGLPGTIGGAVHGNAHFQGKNIMKVIAKINKIDNVILSITFKLKPGDKKELWKIAKEALEYRQKTQPLNFSSAGCIFKNPDFQPAGYLIDQCGLKGEKIGKAMVSPKHANFIVNTGGATCQDVMNVIALCKKKVKEKFDIDLELEIIKMGDLE